MRDLIAVPTVVILLVDEGADRCAACGHLTSDEGADRSAGSGNLFSG